MQQQRAAWGGAVVGRPATRELMMYLLVLVVYVWFASSGIRMLTCTHLGPRIDMYGVAFLSTMIAYNVFSYLNIINAWLCDWCGSRGDGRRRWAIHYGIQDETYDCRQTGCRQRPRRGVLRGSRGQLDSEVRDVTLQLMETHVAYNLHVFSSCALIWKHHF